MIDIRKTSNSITVRGHAHYAEPGKDIVCAGISSLVQTLIKSIEILTVDEIQYDIEPGAVDIKHGNLSEGAQILVDSFFIGCSMIANEYPENVQIV